MPSSSPAADRPAPRTGRDAAARWTGAAVVVSALGLVLLVADLVAALVGSSLPPALYWLPLVLLPVGALLGIGAVVVTLRRRTRG